MAKQYKPGDTILIKVGARRVVTTIDDSGVQRLPKNKFYCDLLDANLIDLNNLAIAYQRGKISFDDYLEFYLNIGYSVCGFADLSSFEHLEISNPVWKE